MKVSIFPLSKTLKFNPYTLKPVKNVKKKNFLKKRKIKKKRNFLLKFKKAISFSYTLFNLNHKSPIYKLRRFLLKVNIKSAKFSEKVKLVQKLTGFNLVKTKINLLDDGGISHTSFNNDIITSKSKKKLLKFFLTITITANNIFINLIKYLKKQFKTVKFWSAGMFEFGSSKKKIKFSISVLLKKVRLLLKNLKIYAIKILAPKHLNKYIFRQFSRLMYKPKFYIYSSFKIFNGCKSKKKRRKKRLRFRYFR